MDAVEDGRSFTVTRAGHEIGQLVPLRQRRVFVPKADFVMGSRTVIDIDLERFRADQDAVYQDADDPYARA